MELRPSATASVVMAVIKLFVCAVFLSIGLAGVGVDADASISEAVDESRSDGSDSVLLEQLRIKISDLEYHIEEKARELKEKVAVIADKEKLIKEKSDMTLSLGDGISSLLENGNSGAVEHLGTAQTRVDELEKQVDKLKRHLEVKINEKEQLEAQITETKKKDSELNTKVNNLQKIVNDQQSKLEKTERALQNAEEEMMKAKFEVATKTKELMEVQGAWFPPWLAAHLIHYQSRLQTKWKIHGKPAFDQLMQTAVEKKGQAEEWAAPHVETMKTKWVPVVKEKWVVITNNVQMLTTKSIEMYKSSKNVFSPHVITVMKLVDPYFQDLRKISNPYIDRIADAARPHVNTLRAVLKPYTDKGVHVSGKFLKSANNYHGHVQAKVEEKLKSHELTEPLATKELVWFSASVLLALPVILLMKICAAVFCRKARRPARYINRNRGRVNQSK